MLDIDSLTLLMSGHVPLGLRAAQAGDLATTVITRIEILRGRFASVPKANDGAELLRAQHWLDQTEQHLNAMHLVSVDTTAAAEFDKLRHSKSLRRIGLADLLIASIALANRAMLVTRNTRHFLKIPGLRLKNWAD